MLLTVVLAEENLHFRGIGDRAVVWSASGRIVVLELATRDVLGSFATVL